MLSSHLPRTPCDKFVYNFLCGFWGIVGGYGLRSMCSHCLRASCDFLYRPSGASRGKSVHRLCGDCAISVELPCSLRSLQKVIVQSQCGFRAEAARRWCGDRGATVPFFSVRPPRGARAGIVRCHLRLVYRLRTYDFKNLYKQNRRGRGARESVWKSHSRLLPPHGGLVEAARKGGYGQDTGTVDPSQAKCELGINYSFLQNS